MWIEIAVASVVLCTRWMSPGGANPLTSDLVVAVADRVEIRVEQFLVLDALDESRRRASAARTPPSRGPRPARILDPPGGLCLRLAGPDGALGDHQSTIAAAPEGQEVVALDRELEPDPVA
jgi:hypothetical protein